MLINPKDTPFQEGKTLTTKETTDVGTAHRVKVEREPVHPQLKVIFERIIQLQQTEERKLLIPVAIKSVVRSSLIFDELGDYASATFKEGIEIQLTKDYSAEQDLSQYAVLIALLGMRDGLDAIRQLRETPMSVGSSAFEQFCRLIIWNETELILGDDAKAVVYAFKFDGGTFGARNATQTLPGVLSDSKIFGGLDLTILQYLRDEEMVYQIFEAKTGDHGLQSNRFGRGDDPDDGRSYYSSDELIEILKGLREIAGAHTWTEQQQKVWANLTGERIPEWLGQETPQWADDRQGFGFTHTWAWVDLNDRLLRSLEDVRGPLEKYSYVEADAVRGGWEAIVKGNVQLPPWPAPLTKLAEKSNGVASLVFQMLQELLSHPKQIMARAGLHEVTICKPLDKNYTVVTTAVASLTNCGVLGRALWTFFRSDLKASPETSLDASNFGCKIESSIDSGEEELLQCKSEDGKAKLYSIDIHPHMMTAYDGKGPPGDYGGHRFVILQYLGPEGKVRYLVLDAYYNQRQGLERLARRSEEDPSWSREEFESFLQKLRKIANAREWTPKHARRYHRAFGVRHPELLGKSIWGRLGMSAQVYPVDLKEVIARNSMESGKLAGKGIIKNIEVLALNAFKKRCNKEMRHCTAWWVTEAKDDADENA